MSVISVEQLKELSQQGLIIKISHWLADNPPIEVKVKQLNISKELLIKNSPVTKLLQSDVAQKFKNKKKNNETINEDEVDGQDIESLTTIMPEIDEVIKSVLLEPTYEEFEKFFPLNLTQKLELFAFATCKIEDLKKNNT